MRPTSGDPEVSWEDYARLDVREEPWSEAEIREAVGLSENPSVMSVKYRTSAESSSSSSPEEWRTVSLKDTADMLVSLIESVSPSEVHVTCWRT